MLLLSQLLIDLQQVSGGSHARRHIHTHAVALLCWRATESVTEVEEEVGIDDDDLGIPQLAKISELRNA